MPNQSNRIKLTVIALVAFAALITGLFVSQYFFKKRAVDTSRFNGTFLSQPRNINAFDLTGTDQTPFNNAYLKGQWTMMFFGFTHCGYLCPTTMAELGKFYRILEDKQAKVMPKVIMISIDPKRDTIEGLNNYVKAFHPDFYGAIGDKSAIKTMTRELGIAYAQVALQGRNGADNYDIEHTGTVLLFNPEGQLNAFFTSPQNAAKLADDFLMLTS